MPEFDALLDAIGGFEATPNLAVAVSGGPDSMALLLLADRWARRRGGQICGLTVDHGLRPESAAEARQVGQWLAARGIPHRVLNWSGEKPRTGIQEAAREARYRLLGDWCRANGVLHLLAAHHREDQAETYLIRRRAGSGPDGLAGMSALRELPGCRLVRPLLPVPRARLAALLEAEGQPYLRDPSNRNPVFERARLRAEPPEHAASAAARAHGERRGERERALDRLIGRSVALHPAGFAAIDRAVLAADDETLERLLGRVAACIGGSRYPARRARLARLGEAFRVQPLRPRTLGGCRFLPWRGRLLVMRELAAAEAPAALEPDASLFWDRRYAVSLPAAVAVGARLGYLGQCGGDRSALRRVPDAAPPRLLWPSLPALWDACGLAAVPHLGFCRDAAAASISIAFRPANPLSKPGFTVV